MAFGFKFLPTIACLLIAGFLTPTMSRALSQTATVTVSQIQPYMGSSATGVLVSFSPAVSGNPEGCGYAGGNQVWLDFSAAVSPSGKDLYATVLAGFLAGRTFIFFVNGCGATARPLVYAISVF